MIIKAICTLSAITARIKGMIERLDAFNWASRGEYHNNYHEVKSMEYNLFDKSYSGFYVDKSKLNRDKQKVTKDIHTAFNKIKVAKS
ncbi:MAG: hypothetical protein SNG38_00130 [Rikenellaceae bacterium]